MKKIFRVFIVITMIFSTFYIMPYQVQATDNVPTIEKRETNLQASISPENIGETGYFTIYLVSLDMPIFPDDSSGNVTVEFKNAATGALKEQIFNYSYNSQIGVQIYGNLARLDFGNNQEVIISRVIFDSFEYDATKFNDGQGLSFMYNEWVYNTQVLGIEFDENNKDVYTENGTYSFIVNVNTLDNGGGYANFKIKDNQGNTRNISASSKKVSDTQMRYYIDIDDNNAAIGEYTLENIQVGDRYYSNNSSEFKDLGFDQIKFKVEFGSDDFLAPQVEKIEANFEKGTIATAGGIYTYTITLSNDEDINLDNSHAQIERSNDNGRYAVSTKLNKIAEHQYSVTIVLDNKSIEGEYFLQILYLTDQVGNHNNFYINDDSRVSFIVKNDINTETPIEIVDINIPREDNIYLTDNDRYQIKITYNRNIGTSSISFSNNQGGYYSYQGEIDNNIVTYTVDNISEIATGVYSIDNVYATNGFESANIYRYDNDLLRSEGFVKVSKDGVAVLNEITLLNDSNQVKPGEKLDFNLKFSSLVNTLNLNFYCQENQRDISFSSGNEGFYETEGILEGYITNKHGNGIYQLNSISFNSNGEDIYIYEDGFLWKKLGLDKLSFEVYDGNTDFTKPEITKVIIDDSQDTNLSPNNPNYTFQLETSEPIDVSKSYFNSRSNEVDSSLNVSIRLLDESKNLYEVRVYTYSNTYDGTYKIDYIGIRDLVENPSYYYPENDLSELNKIFNLTFTTNFNKFPSEKVNIEDIEVIEKNSIYNSKGDVVFKVTVSDPISDLSIGIKNVTYNKYNSGNIKVTSDSTKTIWTVTITVDEKYLNGKYIIEHISLQKADGESDYYGYGNSDASVLSKVDFYVNCGHTNLKVPKITTITADSNNSSTYNEPGKATYYIETSGPVKINSINFILEGYEKVKYVEYSDIKDLGNNRYQFVININDHDYNGNYILYSINLSDDYGNYSRYDVHDNGKGYYYLSGMEFNINCGIDDLTPPNLVRVYGDSQNKELYTEFGRAIYYFEFDEPLSGGNLNINSDADTGKYGELRPIGNNVYVAVFNIDNYYNNGTYKFGSLSASDTSNNTLYYNNNEGSKVLKDLMNISFKVDIDSNEGGIDIPDKPPLEMISFENKNAVFNSYGRQLLYTITFDREISSIFNAYHTGDYISRSFDTDLELISTENNSYTYGVYLNVSENDYSGEYFADHTDVHDKDGNYYSFEFSESVKFTINTKHNPYLISISNLEDEGIDQGVYTDYGVYRFDLTTNKKYDDLVITASLCNNHDPYCIGRDIRITSIEEKSGNFVYHCEFDVDEDFSKGYWYIDGLSFEAPGFSYFTDHIIAENLGLNYCTLLIEFGSTFNVIADENNQAIYKNSGTVSYIVDENIEITKVNMSSISGYMHNPPFTITKLDGNKTRIDVEVNEEYPNNFYTLLSFEYITNGKNLNWMSDYNSLPYFRVDNGSDDYTPPKIINVSNVIFESNYLAQDKKEISFDITFDEKIKEVWIGYYNESHQWYMPTIEYDDNCIHVSMLVDETFESGLYDLAVSLVTDTAGNTAYFKNTDIYDSGMSFEVSNNLDESVGDFTISASTALESGELISNNAWTNEPVYLDLSVPVEGSVTVLVSEDGNNWKEYDLNETMNSGNKTIYVKVETKNGTSSNVKAINVKVDQDKPLGQIIIPQIKNRAAIIQTGYTVVIDASDELSGVKLVEYKLVETGKDESSSFWKAGKTATVPANFEGEIFVRITDNAGNSTILTKKLEKIASLDVTLLGNTEDNVSSDKININATFDEGDSIKYVGIKKNGNEYVDITSTYQDGYTVNENATYSVLVQTNKGAEIEKSISYQNIGKEPVTLSLSGNTGSDRFFDILSININVVSSIDQIKSVTITNGDKVVDITDSYKNGYKIESNGTYLVKVETKSGKTAQQNITYNNIVQQSTELKFELNHNADSQYLIEDTVTFMILPKDIAVESLVVKKDGTEVGNIVDSYSDGYKVTENGTYRFTITTSDGQTATKTVIYNNIDATIPTLSLNGNLASTAATDLLSIEATADTSGIAMVMIQKGDEEPIDITSTYQDGYIISDNGTYTVTLITNSGKNVSTTITYSSLIIPYIKITDSQKTIKPDETFKLTVDTNVEGQLTWTSDNEGVATVDQTGTITAVANGSALITVTTENGLKATYTIQVNDIIYQLGDVNRDGVVNTLDSQMILQASIGLLTLDEEQMILADINQDGNINTLDSQIALQKAIGLIE